MSEDTFIESCRNGDLDCLDKFENISEEILLEGMKEAFNYNHPALVQKLVLHISPKKMDNKLLMKAIEQNNREMIMCLSHAEIDFFKPKEFINPLITAVEEDRGDIFDYLININLDVKKKNILFTVLVQLDHYKYVEILLKDPDVDPLFVYEGKDSLSYAIRKGKYRTLEILLQDRRIKVSFNDLEQAANRPNSQIMKLLLSYYPDDLERSEDLINTASDKDHNEVLEVLFSDLRINPWNIKTSSNQIKQILNSVKERYKSQNHYNEAYKSYQRYFSVCEILELYDRDLKEMDEKMINVNNRGYQHIKKCLEDSRHEICSLKKQLGLLC